MNYPFRVRSRSCIHKETYKYFFDKSDIEHVWSMLEVHYGQRTKLESVLVEEIRSKAFILRASVKLNPITVIRYPECQASDINLFHSLIGFDEVNTYEYYPLED